ncbi:hypothetical protein [Paenibacillus xylanexedens]|uniref:hypothetical protein n=1 Tax=Paenibacillus xylanexedens TaxID=528191 RepID=UPI0011A1B414|nr:hypothetical protein [Paenibacillus xylanexedens]
MAGIANDYLIYPIMDLIQGEIKKITNNNSKAEGDPFSGESSVALKRDHPRDEERVTGALLVFENGYSINLYLSFGCGDDFSGVPVDVDEEHPDWDYYVNWRLESVSSFFTSPDQELLTSLTVKLNYENQRGNFIGTTLIRM